MTDLKGLLTDLSPERLKLLEALLQDEGVDLSRMLVPRQRDSNLAPLSYAQKRLWLIDQLEPGNSAYNITAAVRLAGRLDAGVMERSLNEIVRRHESLRTGFDVFEGEPVQVIDPKAVFRLPAIELGEVPEERREQEARRRAVDEVRRPFDLRHGPLLRVLLLALGPREHLVVVNMHHIVSDGWSMGIFIREMATLYPAFLAGEPSPLPELPVQYADFAEWQARFLEGEVMETELAYWRRQLAGAPPYLELPADRPRPKVQTFRGAQEPIRLSGDLTAALRRAGERVGGTLFMTLLAGLEILLSRYTTQVDVCVGTPIGNRDRVETEPLIGFFVNTLVLRGDLSGNPRVGELLQRVRETTLSAYSHQNLPFEKLVEELELERDLSHVPLFQVMLVLQNVPQGRLELPELTLEPVEVDHATAKFDLTLILNEDGDSLVGAVEYNRDLFDRATVRRLVRHLRTLWAALPEHPQRRLAELPLLTDAEHAQVRVQCNDVAGAKPVPDCAHKLVEARMRQDPDAVALIMAEEAMSYAELDAAANRLGRFLRRSGVAPDVPVGIFLERSLDMVVAILAAMKAGGAYLPLDPGYPADRLAFMVQDSRTPVVVTTRALADKAPAGTFRCVCLDREAAAIAAESPEEPGAAVEPAHLAYVIFTSGSTGRPKGVALSHGGLVNLARAQGALFGLGYGDRVLQFSSLSFDAAVWETVMALGSGAALVLGKASDLTPGPGLVELVRGRSVNVATLPPSALGAAESGLDELETLVVAGEACTADLVERWAPGRRFWNAYGPTEGTVCSSAELCRPGMGSPSIGRPLLNTTSHIADRRLLLAPIGVSGELVIGGAGLARGYLGRPGLTAEKFVPQPWSAEPGLRLYRTGDLVRRLADGKIFFQGRIDHQVKVRGFRIELGEVESVLTSRPEIREALVVTRDDLPGGRGLVAYAVPRTAGAVSAEDLRRALGGKLPEYMVPSYFVLLEELPLLPNGKVDRKALPAPKKTSARESYAAPIHPTQELLAGVFGEVLGMERVGIDESFFELGGHSLLATQVVSRIREAFGTELPLRAVFENPRVEQLAVKVEEAVLARQGRSRPPVERVDRGTGHVPLSFAQQRLWFLDQLHPGSAAYNIPIGVRFRGELDLGVLCRAVGEIRRRHEALRTTFERGDGEPFQVIGEEYEASLPLVDLRALPAPRRRPEARRLAEEEARSPFDLRRGPLLRGRVLALERGEYVGVMTQHHIVSDGWSVGVFLRELGVLYSALASGLPSPLEELPIQYADFAEWQRCWLSGDVLEEELEYWRERLSDTPVLELPLDRPRRSLQTLVGRRLPFELSPRLVSELRTLGRARGATLFMTLLAAFKTLLWRYTAQTDMVVGTPVAGRNQVSTEGLIGFFVNTLALRTDVEPAGGFSGLLERIREVTLGAYAHQELPFEKLVEDLQPHRDLNQTPLFQVMLILQNVPQSAARLPGLALEPFEPETATAKFDLTLELAESADALSGMVEFNRDLFDGTTVARLVEHFRRCLAAVAAAPERCLHDLPLVSAAEHAQLVTEWNDTASGYPRLGLAELFAEQAGPRADAVAVSRGRELLSYGELDRRANRLAHHLRRLGVGPEVGVGLYLERSVAMIVATLAVVKVGGFYVPLDLGYPRARLALMLDDVRAPVLLTTSALAPSLPKRRTRVVEIDRDARLIAAESPRRPAGGASAGNLAYVMYTSGSTGRPKGVSVTHESVARLVRETAFAAFGPEEAFLQLAPVSFDAATLEIWGPLATGGRLAVFPADVPSLEQLGDVVEREKVSTLWLTAGLFHQMADTHVDRLAGVRQLLAGGDVLSPLHVGKVLRELPGCRMINGYGPTENTTFTCCYPMATARSLRSPVPVGRPISGTRAFVLDARLSPVPVGVAGELCAGGAGLARGYLGRPALTAATFVPDPVSGEEDARLYRTGDRVRNLADGRIEFLGRIDHQVKIRGYRIEPGEVEVVLQAQAEVRSAVVLVRDDLVGGRGLVAYVVGHDRTDLDLLRGRLAEKLPDYMVPAYFVALDALPLTPNGKLDRAALPAPDRVAEAAWVAPRTPVETLVAEAFSTVLDAGEVGAEADFFELGGHSLLATQLVSRLRRSFGVEISLREVFEAPRVAELAAAVERALRAEAAVSAPPIERLGRRPGEDLPLSFAQERLYFLDQLQPGTGAYNIPVVLRFSGRLDVAAMAASLREIVRRHEVLRATFHTARGASCQRITAPAAAAPRLPSVDLGALPGASRRREARRLSEAEQRRGFDLSRGPLLRATLLRLGAHEHLALLTVHHIAGDAWSMGVFQRELAALYAAAVHGTVSPLPELAIRYVDFAAWQRDWLSGDVLAAELRYWRQRLGQPSEILELPTDRPRPAVQSYAGGSRSFELSPRLSDQLAALNRAQAATPFMTLLAAFQVLLGRYTGQTAISVGTPIAGRNQLRTEELIGFFVNTLVLRCELRPVTGFEELLRQVRETTLGAYTHQDLPFEKLVEALEPERDLSRSALFQVMFSLQNTPTGGALTLPGLEVEVLPVADDAAKFDLSLTMAESPDRFVGSMSYSVALFDAVTVERLLGHFETLLEAVVGDPRRPFDAPELLTAAQRHQLLGEWNDSDAELTPRPLVELLREQAARVPDAVALARATEQVSFRQLDCRSDELARELTHLGVGPEVRVALLAGRHPCTMAALWGVLKAGGAFVPLDPDLPRARLRDLLEESETSVVITGTDRDALHLERVSDGPAPPRPVAARGDNLAYVLYTSGSTGRPKGVMITRRSLENLVQALRGSVYHGRTSPLKVAVNAPLVFDGSVKQWLQVVEGHRLEILSEEERLDPRLLLRAVEERRVQVLDVTPSHLSQLAAEGFLEPDGGPRPSLLVGGEALSPELAKAIARADAAGSFNVYGPTECTVDAAVMPIRGLTPVPRLGRPIANVRCVVLDARLRPVPLGAPGELGIGGRGVARGYLGQPALSARCFVPDTFSAQAGGRLYRSGDLARLRPDGNVEYLGRIDHQVKVRGFRIELGEIESALGRHPEIEHAVAAVRSGRLVAYLVSTREDPDPAALRAFLKERLPEYMVPAAFVCLASLPTLASGKVDRRSLPEPELGSAGREVEMRGPTEELIAGIWAEVLGLGSVARNDNFFEVGGHSLLATQVVSRMRQTFEVELALKQLFQAPTVAELARHVEERKKAGLHVDVPPIRPRDAGTTELPLSFAQERLWFLDHMIPDSSAYNVPVAFLLRGRLDAAALGRALEGVAQRHEVLRTSFPQHQGTPVQRIAARADVPFTRVDLSGLAEASRRPEVLRLAGREAARTFDLAAGPLLRAFLVRLADDEHALFLNVHHIVSDGWSMGILVEETTALYRALVEGRPSPLPELALQYADFALWQRSWLEGEELERQIGYWQSRLEAIPRRLELPTDRPRPAVTTFRGGSRTRQLRPELSAALEAVGRRQGVTPFMTLLAVWASLLESYSGQDDVVVGSPVAGRTRPEIEGLIGFFVNTLVMRVGITAEASLPQLLGQVRQTTLEAYDHQDLPFERLVEELRIERALDHSPIFQVMLAFQNAPAGPPRMPELRFDPLPFEGQTAKFDLMMVLADSPQGFQAGLEYNADLFDATTAERHLAHFENVLAAWLAEPELGLARLPLLGRPERHALVCEVNDVASSYPDRASIHELFAGEAAARPDAVATVFERPERGEEALTYGELARRARRLARGLRALGVGPEVRVGLWLERSTEMIVAVLGVLEAGGVYVPLDPEYPEERLRFMIADAAVRTVVTQCRMRASMPPFDGPVVEVDGRGEPPPAPAAPTPRISPDQLAYVMYTSGSTGMPKGVAVPHRAVVRLVRETRFVDLGPAEVFLQLAPAAFDAATLEIWGPLLNGGRLVLAPPHAVSLEELGELLRRRRVTTLWLTAGFFHTMCEERAEDLEDVPQLLAGGDALSVPHVRALLEARARGAVINGYGPTENTTFTTCCRLVSTSGLRATVPIGRPISNTSVRVFDRAFRLSPVGVQGELHTGGAGLARGYVGRPALTAERFVPDAFGEEPGARLYCTGDRVRVLNDGRLEFLGRLDHQVKIRGFRIEPGEVETAVSELPGVLEAAVVARASGASAEKSLVAYVVTEVEVDDLRARLRARLPDYMLPSAWVRLETLPLNPNGKVDRRALPAPRELARDSEAAYVAPRTPTEELVAGIFSQVLESSDVAPSRIGVEDDFFRLGGHSLLATRVVSRIRQTFQVDLALRELFQAPTVARLARHVEEHKSAGLRGGAPPIRPRAADATRLPLSFSQERLWLIDRMIPGSSAYNVPVTFLLRGQLDAVALGRALEGVAQRHEVLRTSFQQHEGTPVQRVAARAEVPFARIDLSGLAEARRGSEALRLADLEAGRAFDLSAGPLIRAFLARIADDEHALFLNVHHIATDGWSMGILVEETTALYRALIEGRPSPLPELELQYADFALWQRSWLEGEELERQAGYWRRRLEGTPRRLELPTDRARPAVMTYRGGLRSRQLRPELRAALEELCRRRGVTPFMALLAVWASLLECYSGQGDVVVGSPIAGRTRPEIEGLIGFFVNTMVMRIEVTAQVSLSRLLDQVRQTALEAYDHQDLPFERLVEELRIERALDHSPLFQVLLSFQNTPGAAPQMPELRFDPLPFEGRTAKFDLTLALVDTARGLEAALEYNSDLFDPTTAERHLAHFENVLTAWLEEPDLSLSRLPLLGRPQRHALVHEANDVASSYPDRASVQELFMDQAAARPDAVATAFERPGGGEEALTYAELARRARRLAGGLRALGVGPEIRVGLWFERSTEMVVAMLGVLEAGGIYVPLDPEYPEERLRFMVADAAVETVVTQSRLRASMPGFAGPVVEVDKFEAAGAPEARTPAPRTSPDQLAYVMYTSGSTGVPKGVAVAHRGIVRLVRETNFADLGPSQVFLQLAPASFDLATLEVWAPLLNGGRLVVAPPHAVSLEELGELLRRRRVTTLWLTAGFFHTMCEERAEDLADVPQLLAGGDALSLPLVRALLGARRRGEVINGYGPTENTTFTTCCRLVSPSELRATVPIGRPISNTSVRVFDRAFRLTPVGVQGELHTGGAGLARGYVGRPALTAERFVPDALGEEPGARLYRTGDLVRVLNDGRLEFLGRLDHQVKIRGFRIEPGEVETAVLELAGVLEAAVVAPALGAGGEKSLVAYVVTEAEVDDLRARLRARLPDYMLPSAWVKLEALPLTPNGKVDRRALPAPYELSRDVSHVAPRTPTEELLAAIFGQALEGAGAPARIGVHDDFFELGGHSLLATRVVSRILRSLAVAVPLTELFRNPTVASLAAWVDAEKARSRGVQLAPLRPLAPGEVRRLSFAQERLWFLAQFEPDSPAYNVPILLRLVGHLDVAALEAAMAEIVRRHEVLRTTFELAGDEPVQRLGRAGGWRLPECDLSALPRARKETETRHLALAEILRPFDLAAGPLVRTTLLRRDASDVVLLVNQHHIVSDGWSMGLLVNELSTLYRAFLRREPSPLAELPVQYADFAAWQRSWLEGEELERQLGYWRTQLDGAPVALELPLDHPRPPMMTMRGATCPLELSDDSTRRLERFAQQEGATLFMTLLSAWASLLSRNAGQTDVLVGSPVANRTRPEVEGLIGFFVNTLVLRVDVSGGPDARSLLARVRETALEAYSHQDLPFERLVDELQVKRALDRSAVFQVLLVLQNTPSAALELPGLTLGALDVESTTSKFDMTFRLVRAPQRLHGVIEYCRDLFDPTTIQRLAGHFESWLAGMLAEPHRPVSELSYLTSGEHHELLTEWNDTDVRAPEGPMLHDRLDQVARRTPDAVALVCEDRRSTCADLVRRSNRLAAELRRRGVGPEVFVGVSAHRTLEMVVGIWAILKAGGAYVPMDPTHPAERLEFVVEDAGISLLLTQQHLVDRFPPVRGVVLLDTGVDPSDLSDSSDLSDLSDVSDSSGAATGRTAPGGSPDHPAYVIYTSGSTGRPKGVVVAHRQVLNYVAAVEERVRWSPGASFAMVQPLSVDSCKTVLFPPFLSGGCLHVIPQELGLEPEKLADYFERHRIDVLKIAPSHLAALCSALGTRSVLPEQRLVIGGEASRRDWAVELSTGAACEVFCHYGPTETTVGVTAVRIDRHVPSPPSRNTPIGRPMRGVRVYVLDARLGPVARGVVGELLIGGTALARGYLGRPGLTAERFIPSPFARGAKGAGTRLYKTGDLVRTLAGGLLEFLSRIDHQIKVHGFRIEPGEIEAVLCRHPQVREALLVLRDRGPSKGRLVGYVTAREGTDPDPEELRRFVAQSLPGPMVPSAVVVLRQLPLTPHGKVDRHALPEPEAAQRSGQDAVTARDSVEHRLARIWAELLGVERIGVDDNFFDVGGHSLLAIRLMARIRQDFGLDLPLTTLFQNDTVEELAAVLRSRSEGEERSALVAIQPRGSRTPFFCVHPVGGNVFCYLDLARRLGPDQPFYALQSPDPGEHEWTTLEQLAALYVESLRQLRPEGPYRLGGWSMGGLVALEMTRRLRDLGEEVDLALIDTWEPSLRDLSARVDDATLVGLFARDLAGLSGFRLPEWEDEELERQPQKDLIALLYEKAAGTHWFPPGLELSQVRSLYEMFAANYRAQQRYSVPATTGRLVLFRAGEPPGARPAPADLGWRRVSGEALEVHEIPGNHYTMMREPHVGILAERLREHLLK